MQNHKIPRPRFVLASAFVHVITIKIYKIGYHNNIIITNHASRGQGTIFKIFSFAFIV